MNQRAIWARKIHGLCCNRGMPPTADSLPDDVATLKAMVIATQIACLEAEAKARNAEAEVRVRELLMEQMKFTIAKLKHEQYGQSSERSAVLEQLELRLADVEEDASQAEAAARIAAEAAARQKVTVVAFERRKPARRPLPEHLPRERVVHPSPTACPCCGGALHKLGEDVTETLELVPRQWKVIAHVREKFSCRSREAITQPPAPWHPIPRGRAGPGLLGTYPVRKIRAAPAAQPPERRVCPRGHRARRLDARRLGRRRGRNPDAAGRGDPVPCVRRRAHPCG